jgi:hypothetical protein
MINQFINPNSKCFRQERAKEVNPGDIPWILERIATVE